MPIRIARHLVGDGAPMFTIAEIGLNHGGSIDHALALVDAAAHAGASAVKLQTLRAARLVAPHCPAPAHVQAASLVEFFAQFELDGEAHDAVATRARARGLAMMSTPFDLEAVDLLESIGIDAYKIASGDVTFHQLIARAASTGKPVVISTGMAEMHEIDAAVRVARAAGARELALLHCVSAYPVPEGQENLRAIATLKAAFDLPVGLSDHSHYEAALVVASVLGASLWERHLVLRADSDSIDAAVSSTPDMFARAVADAARARVALGDGVKTCLAAEAVNRRASRRGLYAARDLRAGESLDDTSCVALRPETDVPAHAWTAIAGRRLEQPVRAGAAIAAQHLAPAAGGPAEGGRV